MNIRELADKIRKELINKVLEEMRLKSMERRKDLPPNLDDIPKPKKERKKSIYVRKKKKYNNDLPYIDDELVFKAVSFVRALINKESPDPIGLAIYKAAKYYKVSQKKVASAVGTMANHIKKKYKRY